jgi:hypothetical protein
VLQGGQLHKSRKRSYRSSLRRRSRRSMRDELATSNDSFCYLCPANMCSVWRHNTAQGLAFSRVGCLGRVSVGFTSRVSGSCAAHPRDPVRHRTSSPSAV